MATLEELHESVVREYDSRHLVSDVRYKALDKVINFIKDKFDGDISCLELDKSAFKSMYATYKGKKINSAESSSINELYNQYYRLEENKQNITTTKNESVNTVKKGARSNSDEYYVIGLCNKVLGKTALQQYRFDFLVGDSGKKLPVDAYYPELNLVIEYRERQHTESVKFFDKKNTVSGVPRGAQRRIYDQRRRDVLPKHGIDLVEISYSDFGTFKKLKRDEKHDLEIVKRLLSKYL